MDIQVQIGNYIFRTRSNSNGTYYSYPPVRIKEEEGIPLPPIQKERILAKFESSSNPGSWHLIIQSPLGETYCTCWGFSRHKNCWHHELVMEIGPSRLTSPLIIKGKADGKSEVRFQ